MDRRGARWPDGPRSVVSSRGEHGAGVGVVVGEALEVNHAVVVDRDEAHDRPEAGDTGFNDGARHDSHALASVAEQRPVPTVVVLGVEVRPQLYAALIVADAACGLVFFYFWPACTGRSSGRPGAKQPTSDLRVVSAFDLTLVSDVRRPTAKSPPTCGMTDFQRVHA